MSRTSREKWMTWLTISFMGICVFVFAYFTTSRWCRVRKAMTDWQAVGGSVDVGDLPIIGPSGITIGTTPGFEPVQDLDQILAALDEMRELRTVERLSLSGLPLTSKQLQEIAKEWQGAHIHVSRLAFDDACLQAALDNAKLRTLSISECPVSASALLKIKQHPKVVVRIVVSDDISDLEVAELRRELGKQIKVYGRKE
ncbi:MAG: hypothetical protein U0894_10730 [Pirellulales bacterium]